MGLSVPCCFRWRFNHLGAALTALSCVCAFGFWRPGTLCWSPVCFTAGKPLGFFEVMAQVFFLPLLVAPSLEAPQRGPARFCGWSLSLWPSGWRLRSSTVAADSRSGMVGHLSSPPSGVADGAVSVPLMLCASTRIYFRSILVSSRLSLVWDFSGLVQVVFLPRPLGACRSTLCLTGKVLSIGVWNSLSLTMIPFLFPFSQGLLFFPLVALDKIEYEGKWRRGGTKLMWYELLNTAICCAIHP